MCRRFPHEINRGISAFKRTSVEKEYTSSLCTAIAGRLDNYPDADSFELLNAVEHAEAESMHKAAEEVLPDRLVAPHKAWIRSCTLELIELHNQART